MITIGEKYRVSRKDEYNWVVEKYIETVKKKTNEKAFRWKDMGVYLRTLDRCLTFIGNDMIQDGLEDVDNLSGIVKKIESTRKEFKKAINTVIKQVNEGGAK